MKIAVFGGVGSGKSTVLQILRERYHAKIYEADKMAHVLYRKNAPGYKAILRICGRSVLDENREIDRKKLAVLVYGSEEIRTQVNAAIHAMVWKKARILTTAWEKAHPGRIAVVEAALLPKEGFDFFDSVWYIDTDPPVRRQRLKDSRGYTDERISEIMAAQPSEEEYRRVCDVVIDNSGSLEELAEEIHETIKHCQRKQR